MAKKKLVVLGNSAAGIHAIDAFRKLDRQSTVTLVDAEDRLAYSRVLTTFYLDNRITEDGLFIRDRDDYRRLGVKTIFGARATRLNTRYRPSGLSAAFRA